MKESPSRHPCCSILVNPSGPWDAHPVLQMKNRMYTEQLDSQVTMKQKWISPSFTSQKYYHPFSCPSIPFYDSNSFPVSWWMSYMAVWLILRKLHTYTPTHSCLTWFLQGIGVVVSPSVYSSLVRHMSKNFLSHIISEDHTYYYLCKKHCSLN